LSGTGILSAIPELTVSPGSLDFGDGTVGTKSDALPVTLTNTGSVPVKISTFRIHGADPGDFAQGAACPISPDALAVGASCIVYVSFTATSTGPKSATLEVGDDAGSSPQVVPLSGNGKLGASITTLSPASLSFGDQLVGIKSDAQAVTISNDGPGPLSIATFRLQGADADDFAQGADCPIAPQQLVDVAVATRRAVALLGRSCTGIYCKPTETEDSEPVKPRTGRLGAVRQRPVEWCNFPSQSVFTLK
jgi:hypothetical protein